MGKNRKQKKAAAAKAAAVAAAAAEEKKADAEAAIHDPSNPLYMKSQGNEAFLRGDFRGAIEWFTKGTEAEPENKVFFGNRAACYLALFTMDGYRKALADAEKAAELDPEWHKAYYRMGLALKGLGRYPDAKASFLRAKELAPGNAEYASELVALSKMKQSDFMPETEDGEHDKDKFELLEDWLRTPTETESSVAEFPLLYMKRYSENNRGVHCRVNIKPGTRIMTIPRRYLITVEMGKESEIGEKMLKFDCDVTAEKHCFLCIFTMVDRLNMSSYFQPYYNILPTSYPNMPIFWNEEELSWLDGSYLLKQISDRIANIKADYDEIARAAPEFERFTMEEFKWARMMVASRNFGVTPDEGLKTDALVPYADMLNHYRPRETRWTFNRGEQCFTIDTLLPLKAGQQVYDSYGKKCNSRFLLNYGFAVENNSDPGGQNHNEVRLLYSLRDEHEDPFYRQRKGLVQDGRRSRGIRVGTWYDYKTTLEAFSFLRFAYAKAEELLVLPALTHDLDLATSPILPISCENEIEVLLHFADVFGHQLENYPTTLEQDNEDIASGKYEFGTNRRNVVVVLRGEKEVCQYYVDIAHFAIPLLAQPWKEVKKALNKVQRSDAGPDVLKYCRMVITPLVKKRSSSSAGPVVLSAKAKAFLATRATVEEVGAGAGAGSAKKKKKGRK